jgi:NodT family efflux transporter outer membrane factor (OMF) lipoprotein
MSFPLSPRFALVGLAVLLSACSWLKPTPMPALDLPPPAATGPWQSASQVPPADAAWWQLFQDPVLDDLQRQLVLGNHNLQAMAALVRQAQAAVGTAQASLYPTVNANLGVSRSENTPATVTGTNYSLSAPVAWEVDLWGRVSGLNRAADARLQASREDLAAARLSAQSTLVQTYLSLRSADQQLAVLDQAVLAYEKSLQLTEFRYQAGVVSAADVAQAQLQLQTAQAQRLDLRTQRTQLVHALAVVVGQSPSALALAPRTQALGVPELPQSLSTVLLLRRPDVAAAERRVAAANAQVGVTQAAFFPTLTLSANAGYRNQDLGSLVSASNVFWSVGPTLLQSVFDGGLRRAARADALAARDASVATYRQTVLTAMQELEDNLVAAAQLALQAQVQTQALQAARRNLSITEAQYRAGAVSYLSVVTAQTSELSAERGLIDVQTRRMVAINALLRNLAGRWPEPEATGATGK